MIQNNTTIDATMHDKAPSTARGLPLGAPRLSKKFMQPMSGSHENANPIHAQVVGTTSLFRPGTSISTACWDCDGTTYTTGIDGSTKA